jgi:restriction system protein
VARASLEELLLDFEDFLRQRGLALWSKDDPRALAVRRRYQSDQSDREAQAQARKRKQRPRIRCLSLGLSLSKQPPLLHRQLQQLEQAFLAEGGFTERLYRERQARRQNP